MISIADLLRQLKLIVLFKNYLKDFLIFPENALEHKLEVFVLVCALCIVYIVRIVVYKVYIVFL